MAKKERIFLRGMSRSGKRWHMADEILYVLSGQASSLHWDVGTEIDDKYHVAYLENAAEYDAGRPA
jgi:hypothetical protein